MDAELVQGLFAALHGPEEAIEHPKLEQDGQILPVQQDAGGEQEHLHERLVRYLLGVANCSVCHLVFLSLLGLRCHIGR